MSQQFCVIAPDVKLGRDVIIYNFVNLYGCEIGDGSKIGSFVEIQKGTRVGRNCKVSSHTFIWCGVTIGEFALVGAGAVVIDDVPANATVAGNPGRVLRSRET